MSIPLPSINFNKDHWRISLNRECTYPNKFTSREEAIKFALDRAIAKATSKVYAQVDENSPRFELIDESAFDVNADA